MWVLPGFTVTRWPKLILNWFALVILLVGPNWGGGKREREKPDQEVELTDTADS